MASRSSRAKASGSGRHWLRMNRSDDPQVGVIARGDEIKRLRESTQTAARRADEVAQSAGRHSLPARAAGGSSRAGASRGHAPPRACSPTRRPSSAPVAPSSIRRGNEPAALDRTIAELAAEQQALVSAVEESRAQRGARGEPPERLGVDARRVRPATARASRTRRRCARAAPSSTAKRRKRSQSRWSRGVARRNLRARRCFECRANSRT